MKLRNKQTGGIWDIPKMRHPTMQEDDISFFAYGKDEGHLFSYKSLAELNEEWEDYKPKEPLIKDEKVRKAIRAFAELHDSKTITFDETYGGASFISRADNGYSMLWVLGKSWGAENIESGKPYTIVELCGEEEE